jgi:hypothetical protein
MNKKFSNYIAVVLITLVFVSCKTVYRPHMAYTPVFKKKNELKVDIGSGSGGTEMQLGFAMTENFALVTSFVYDKSRARVIDTLYSVKDGNSNYQNIAVEGGLGYFKYLDKDSTKYFSLFAGGGYGQTNGYSDRWYAPNYVAYDASYYKVFWQPTYTFVGDFAEFSLAARFRFLQYTSFINRRGDHFQTGMNYFIEPVATLKLGTDQFKFFIQGGTSIVLKNSSAYTKSPIIFGVGFQLNILNWKTNDDMYFED